MMIAFTLTEVDLKVILKQWKPMGTLVTIVLGFLLSCLSQLQIVHATSPELHHNSSVSDVIPYPHTVLPIPQLGDAIHYYETKLDQLPQSSLDRVTLAGLYIKMARRIGDVSLIDKAEIQAKKSLELLPYNNFGAMLILSKVEEERHHFPEAIRIAEQVLLERPGHDEALTHLVTAHLGYGDLTQASQYANQIVARQPYLDAFILRALVNESRGLEDQAILDLKTGILREDVNTVESSAYARALLGRIHLSRGRHELAQANFQEALRIWPGYHLALSLMALSKERTGSMDEAEAYFVSAFESLNEPPYLIEHARMKTKQSDSIAAERLFYEAEVLIRNEISNSQYGHHNELARLLLERGRREEIDEAVHETEVELKARPNSNSFFLRAWALLSAGRLEEALIAIQLSIQSGKKDAQYFYLAGLIMQKLHQREKAVYYFNQSLAIDPSFEDAKVALKSSSIS
jgi:tetratricopeptide (TPR) repeat protein